MLEYPERAERLREIALRGVTALNAAQMVSSNIGCRMHLAAGIARQGLNLRIQHPLTWLAQKLVRAST